MELTDEQRAAIEQQKEHCPFCQIVAGKIPATKVFEDERILVVLDINPASKGHMLVMPKEHYPIMPLVPEEDFVHIFAKVRELSHHARKALMYNSLTTYIASGQAAGQQSPHFMVHLIPSDGVPKNFDLPHNALDQQQVTQAHQMIAHNLPLMMRNRSGLFPMEGVEEPEPIDLATMLQSNPALQQLIMEHPDQVIAEITTNPQLQQLFEGVDINLLSQQLKDQQEIPAPVEVASTQESFPPPQPAEPEEPPTTQQPAVQQQPTQRTRGGSRW